MDFKLELEKQGRLGKQAARRLAVMASGEKNAALLAMADALQAKQMVILQANAEDVARAEQRGISASLLDRLRLNASRIDDMAEGLRQVASLPDPIGEVLGMWRRPNGLEIGKVRVPLGVIGMIYEARPNVTVDEAGLCLKSGNAVLLRGGSEAISSNLAMLRVLVEAGEAAGLPAGAIQMVTTTDREAVQAMLRLTRYPDVMMPRGGARLSPTLV